MGFVFQALGDVSQANASANSASYQAQVARNNATISRQNAEYAGQAGQEAAMVKSLEGAAAGGHIKASQAANGVDVNSGSAVTVQQSQREASKLDTLTTENNALLEAYGYKSQATNFEAQAGLEDMQASNAWKQLPFDLVGDFLSDAKSVAASGGFGG